MNPARSSHLYSILILSIAISVLMGCKKDNSASPLEGCCDIPGINGSVGNGHLYVANIITSNADGINDIVWPYSDQHIILILSFQIRDKEGKLVYEVLNESPNDAFYGWDGRIDGQWIEGVYDLRVQAKAEDGTIGILEGKVCNFRCRDLETSETISAEGCQFPTQVTDGHFDATIPSFEQNDCFE